MTTQPKASDSSDVEAAAPLDVASAEVELLEPARRLLKEERDV
jgi:hypothetical protein